MAEKIESYQQLKGICQALYHQDILSDAPIEDDKEFDIIAIDKGDRFHVEISYIGHYIQAKHESDPHEPYRYTMVLIVKLGDKVHKVVKDILSELNTIYDAELPEVRTEQELKELQITD